MSFAFWFAGARDDMLHRHTSPQGGVRPAIGAMRARKAADRPNSPAGQGSRGD